MAQQELTKEQVGERVAILKRFKQLLEQQRQKFRDYLVVLEKQAEMISSENIDAMVTHTEMEQTIVAEIHTIQKVIDPLEDMYRFSHPEVADADIPRLKTDMNQLRKNVLEQNKKNRDLLKSHMQVLRQKAVMLQNPYTKRASVYASDSHTASIIDIKQ